MRFGNDLLGVHFLSLFRGLPFGCGCLLHSLIPGNVLEICLLHMFLQPVEPGKQLFKRLRACIGTRKSRQKLLEAIHVPQPSAAQRGLERRLDACPDHPSRHGDLALQALAKRSLFLDTTIEPRKLLDAGRQGRQIEAIGLDDVPIRIPPAPAFSVGTVLECDHTDLCKSPCVALEGRQRETGLFHQIGIGGPDDRTLPSLPVLGLCEGPKCVEKQHIAGFEADMCADALNRHEGLCLGNGCSFAGLCVLFSDR